MIRQTTFYLSAKRRGCHQVTQEILENLPKPLPQCGMLNLFVQHTSCALSINENYDPTDGRLNMGTWQGLYLCEFRNHGGSRRIVATIYG